MLWRDKQGDVPQGVFVTSGCTQTIMFFFSVIRRIYRSFVEKNRFSEVLEVMLIVNQSGTKPAAAMTCSDFQSKGQAHNFL